MAEQPKPTEQPKPPVQPKAAEQPKPSVPSASQKSDTLQTTPGQTKTHFDDKGHMPETDVANKDEQHVHTRQIEDMGTAVGQTRNENNVAAVTPIARKYVARSNRPTAADAPYADDPPTIYDSEEVSDDQRPENMAQMQTDAYSEEHKDFVKEDKSIDYDAIADDFHKRLQEPGNHVKTTVTPPMHTPKAGVQDGGCVGSRVGNPLHMVAESIPGDKIIDLREDGKRALKILTKDKARAIAVFKDDDQGEDIPKLKVHFRFPPINHHVAQREFVVQVANQPPHAMLMTPDTSSLDVLVTPNEPVHAELTHIDQDGRRGNPYVVDFYSNAAVTPKPLGPSALFFRIMESVLTKGQPKKEVERKADEPVKEFPRKEMAGIK